MTAGRPRRIAVVGGGISGLAAAHRLIELSPSAQSPLEVSLFETSDRLGGVFGTVTVGEYRLELGADMFITDKPWGLELCRRLGLEDRLISPEPKYRKSLILHRGRPAPTPDAFNLMVPGRVWPILSTPLLSPLGKLRLMCEPLIKRRTSSDDESLASFVRRRLGSEALDNIIQPLVGGIYTGDPEKLSLAATLPRFIAMEREQGSLTRGMWRSRPKQATNPEQEASGARYGLFVSLRDGMGELQAALIERIAGAVQYHQSTPVTRLEPLPQGGDGRYRLETAAGSETVDDVILAVPSHQAAELVSDWQPQLAAELRGIEYVSSVVVVTGHRLSDIDHPLDAYGLVVPARERRKILAVSFLNRKFPARAPEGRAILRTFVGGALQPELCEQSDDDLQQMVASELEQILGVRGRPEVTQVVRYRRAMPQYHVGHLGRVRRIETLQQSIAGLHLCGNAYRGVGLPDCIHDAELAAEAVLAKVASASGE